jgi:hypothetical protein
VVFLKKSRREEVFRALISLYIKLSWEFLYIKREIMGDSEIDSYKNMGIGGGADGSGRFTGRGGPIV